MAKHYRIVTDTNTNWTGASQRTRCHFAGSLVQRSVSSENGTLDEASAYLYVSEKRPVERWITFSSRVASTVMVRRG